MLVVVIRVGQFSPAMTGIDGGKKIKGRKRHVVVDIMGNLLAVYVHLANLHDTTMGIIPAIKAHARYPRIKKFCGDAGYKGQ